LEKNIINIVILHYYSHFHSLNYAMHLNNSVIGPFETRSGVKAGSRTTGLLLSSY
jgi:hypothetical protein